MSRPFGQLNHTLTSPYVTSVSSPHLPLAAPQMQVIQHPAETLRTALVSSRCDLTDRYCKYSRQERRLLEEGLHPGDGSWFITVLRLDPLAHRGAAGLLVSIATPTAATPTAARPSRVTVLSTHRPSVGGSTISLCRLSSPMA